jgi:predicted transcriptional regulator
MTKPLHELTVADLMSRTVHTIKEGEPVHVAIQKMAAARVSALIVLKSHDHDAYGIITRKDIVVEAAESWDGLAALKVHDLATKPAVEIQAHVGVKHAVRLMRLVGVRRLLVLDGDKLVGVLSNSDVFKRLAQEPAPAQKPGG